MKLRLLKVKVGLLLIFILLLTITGAWAKGSFSTVKLRKPAKLVIETGGEVNMSKCAPCHRNLNAFLTKGQTTLVNFRHEVHFQRGIKCSACHTEWPHQKSKLVKPKMDACIVCHRLEHGNQGEIAPSASNCSLCHPPGFNLNPHQPQAAGGRVSTSGQSAGRVTASRQVMEVSQPAVSGKVASGGRSSGTTVLAHKELKNGQKETASTKLQKCLVCHPGSFCSSCHQQQNVQVKVDGWTSLATQSYRYYPLWPQPKFKGSKIVIDNSPIVMGKCNPCHTNLELWQNDKLINFKHRVHLQRQITCRKCHDSWPHKPGLVKKPKMSACIKCHRLSHGSQGRLVAAENNSYPPQYCSLCHPSTMSLKPDFHTVAFIGGAHKDWAKKDRGLCRGCHTQSFCDSCHQTEIPHPEGWKTAHGAEVASVETTQGENLFCFKCHQPQGPTAAYKKAPSCAKCHKAVVYPHKQPWAPVHGKIAKTEGRGVCYTCHQSYQFCQGCHGTVKVPHPQNWIGQHRQVLQNENAEVCLRCHNKQSCEFCHERHAVHNRNSIYKIEE